MQKTNPTSAAYACTDGGGYHLPEYPFIPPPELASGAVHRHPIVIVGGGITGLTLACSLAWHGVPCVLLDEDNTVGVKGASSRGICYTQKSLEIFDKLGIYQRIAAKGIRWSIGRTFAGNDEVYAFDLSKQGDYNLSQQPPFINIQQFYIEGFLVERIVELGHADLRWCSKVSAFEQLPDHARLRVETPAGGYWIEAAHVIDATGSSTPFHGWCGAVVQAKRGDDRWCIADVRFKHQPPTERHTWIEAPFNDGRAVWQHLMADNVWRIDYQMAPNADSAYVSREDVVRERLARQFGPEVAVEIVWVGPYGYRSQCVEQMRVGNVFFIGDTAKVVSPFGARGGNTGVSDADNLAWKLAALTKRLAPLGLLDAYHAERHEAALENVQVTNRTARYLRATEGIERTFRSASISLAKQYPFARHLVNTGRMAVANRYRRSPVCAVESNGGRSVQNVGFRWGDGSSGQLNDLLAWCDSRLLLLWFGALPSRAQAARLAALTSSAPVRCVQVLPFRGARGLHARESVLDAEGHLHAACHLTKADGTAWALLRPDSYLAASGRAIDPSLIAAVATALGLHRAMPAGASR